MNAQQILHRYVELCAKSLLQNSCVCSMLKRAGLADPEIIERYSIGYADGQVTALVGSDDELLRRVERIGVISDGKEILHRRITIPVLDVDAGIVNIVGYSPWPNTKNRLAHLNAEGIFNAFHLKHSEEMILVDDPIHALLLIRHGVTNATFAFGDDAKYVTFCRNHHIRSVSLLFEGRARLRRDLEAAGIAVRRIELDPDRLRLGDFDREMFVANRSEELAGEVEQIEGGFLFRFPLLSYRVLGNFGDKSLHMRVNIKAFTDDDAFVDAIDLVKHRNRQNFVFNLMDRFTLRDQVQLEQDLNRVVEVIEEHKEEAAKHTTRIKPELTTEQHDIGIRLLTCSDLIDEIAGDYEKLGYVQERKNKVLLYLVSSSRFGENESFSVNI